MSKTNSTTARPHRAPPQVHDPVNATGTDTRTASSQPTASEMASLPEVARSREAMRDILDAAGVGEEVGPSMKAVRAIVLRLAAHLQIHPHVLPALDIIHEVADLVPYLRLTPGLGSVVGFEPGRTTQEVRTVLATMPADEAGQHLGLALRVATGAVQRDANRTIIHADGIIQDVLKAVADNCAAYKNAADDRERLGVTMTTANAIRSISGTAPRTSFVEEALQVILRRRGRTTHLDQLSKPTLTVDGVTTTKSKALVLEQLLLCVGYDVANVYDYMPKAAPTPIAGEVSQDESSALAKRPNEFVSSNGLRTGRALL